MASQSSSATKQSAAKQSAASDPSADSVARTATRRGKVAPAAPIKGVVFDAYGTLFDVYSVAALAEQCYPGRGEQLTQLWRSKQLEYSWLRTMSGRYKPFWEITRDALRFSASKLGLALDGAAQSQLMNQYARLSAFAESTEALRDLKAMGLPLGILSNGNHEMIEISMRSAGMQGCFDFVLSSESVSCFKTSPRLYELGPAAFGCAAGEILFVSSNCWDAIAATWYGYRTFWINRAGAPLEVLDTEPTGTGSLLTDVVRHLRAVATPAAPSSGR